MPLGSDGEDELSCLVEILSKARESLRWGTDAVISLLVGAARVVACRATSARTLSGFSSDIIFKLKEL
jgi:hypothetical protein